MSKKTPITEAPQATTEPAGGWPADEFTGVGGRYVRDPLTGVRRPAAPAADETLDAGPLASDE